MYTQYPTIDGTIYGHEIKTGRHKAIDPKELVALRLHRSIRAIIAGLCDNERKFIEDAVYHYVSVIQERPIH
jgi:hypothetical protein